MEIKELLKELQDDFEKKISAKNSWGKNEITTVFRESLTNVVIEYLNKLNV